MQYRPLGATGLKASQLGFGCGRFAGESDAIAAIRVAYDFGVNYFDVAPLYGNTQAEITLGKALRGLPRERVIVATKIGRYITPDSTIESDYSALRTRRSVDESLARLGLNYVDIIQSHDSENADLDQLVNETLPALRSVCVSGKARFVGITGFPMKLFTELIRKTQVGAFDVALSYGHYTLQNTGLAELAPQFKAHGVAIVNAAPFGMGFFTGRREWWHESQNRIAEVCAKAKAYCTERGILLPELALQFSASHPDFATTVAGMKHPDEVCANLAALSRPIDTALVSAVQSLLAPVRDLAWPAGRTDYHL